MKMLRNMSIKNKLVGIILLVSTLTIILGFFVIVVKDIIACRSDMMQSTIMKAKLIGEYCVSPLAFNDIEGAEDILKKLQTIPHIVNGCVYDMDGRLFASYSRSEDESIPSILKEKIPTEFRNSFLHVSETIAYDGQEYGTIYLRASTSKLDAKIRNNLLLMLLLIVGLVLLSHFLALQFHKVILKPILALADVTRRVSQEGDYSIRVEKRGSDEVGILKSCYRFKWRY